jgi:hypothetical protein
MVMPKAAWTAEAWPCFYTSLQGSTEQISAGATTALQDGMHEKRTLKLVRRSANFIEESTLIFWYDSVEIASSSP